MILTNFNLAIHSKKRTLPPHKMLDHIAVQDAHDFLENGVEEPVVEEVHPETSLVLDSCAIFSKAALTIEPLASILNAAQFG